MKNIILALFAISIAQSSFAVENECQFTSVHSRENVYISVYEGISVGQYDFLKAEIISKRNNGKYVLELEKNASNQQYATNVALTSIYKTSGCITSLKDKELVYSVGDIVYRSTYSANGYKWSKEKIVALSDKKALIGTPNNSELDELENSTYENIESANIDNLYLSSICSFQTDDGNKLCTGSIAIDLSNGVDIEVLAMNYHSALVVSQNDSTKNLYTISISNLMTLSKE